MASEPRYMPLPRLFQGVLYRVPDYQRGYAWTRRQLDDLWSDIELLDEAAQHFTGMIVVERRGERYNEQEMEPFQTLEVIDGQQRLTTLVILLQAIARELRLIGGEEPTAQALKLERHFLGRPDWWRLRLNEDSRVYFEHLLAEGEPLAHIENGSQQNLRNAVRYFRDKLGALADAPTERYAQLTRLVARLQRSLRFVFYQVDDDAEAGLIFEVMNNRGKALSQADLLKNYLMYLAHKVRLSPDAVEGIARSWGAIFKQVMRASPDGVSSADTEGRLLRNHWILYREASPPKHLKGLSISQRVRRDMLLEPAPAAELEARNAALGQAAQQYTRSLLTCAHDFAELANPHAPNALEWIADAALRERVRDELASFHQMGHAATALPVLLAGRRRLERRPELFHALARALSIFSFRVYAMCNRRGHTGQAHFRRVARNLFACPDADLEATVRAIVADVKQWTGWYGGDGQMLEALTDRNFYNQHRAQEIRYLFFEYERALCHGQQPALDWAAFSDSKTTQVEHIWPRGLPWLGDKQKKHDKNVNRLGNLTVSHFNQTLGKKPFTEKKKIYARSSLLIEHTLQKHRSWGLGHVDRREKALVDFVAERWAL